MSLLVAIILLMITGAFYYFVGYVGGYRRGYKSGKNKQKPDQAWSLDKTTQIPAPTEDELSGLVMKKWRELKPSYEAQKIRSSLTFDSGKYSQPDCDFMPTYVWEIADIAAQMGLNALLAEPTPDVEGQS